MKPSKTRLASIKGQVYPIEWNMPALFLFAEYAELKTVEECERAINKALLDVKSASDNTLKGTPIDSVKFIVKMVRAAVGGAVSEKELTTLLGKGELDEALQMTVEAYVDNLPDFESGVTQDAPKAVKKKSFRLRGFLKWLRKWTGNLRTFGMRQWANLFTREKGTT